MERITAKLRVTTPAFIGGADSQAELRPPTIKGLLRFWFRALYHHSLQQEAVIFGAVGKEEKDIGQSTFLLRIGEKNIEKINCNEWQRINQGIAYLGYGPLQYSTENHGVKNMRQFIKPDSIFYLEFIFKEAKEEYIKPVLQSLWLLCHFGGIGSRSRRGFGSLELVTIDGIPSNLVDEFKSLTKNQLPEMLKAKILGWSTSISLNKPTYTSFCRGTRILTLNSRQRWDEALRNVGEAMKGFRSKGDLYYHDRDLIRKYIESEIISQPPKRSIFGLPHNYHFKDDDRSVEIFPKDYPKFSLGDRRASPLFIHIHRSGNDYIPILSFFPGIFLPEDASLSIKKMKKSRGEHTGKVLKEVELFAPTDYSPIEDFLNQLKVERKAQEVIL